jgi:hypothetical protein
MKFEGFGMETLPITNVSREFKQEVTQLGDE